MKKPEIGQKIYIQSMYYIERGQDDFNGGLATIDKIINSNHLPKSHYNYCMIELKELPNRQFNYNYLLENQENWAKEYKDKIVELCPDYNSYGMTDWRETQI
jgi:hypothetical protein